MGKVSVSTYISLEHPTYLILPKFRGSVGPVSNRILYSIVHLFKMALTADSILHKIFDLSYFSDIYRKA